MSLFPSMVVYVIMLTINGQTFEGSKGYHTELQCYKAAFNYVLTTSHHAYCKPVLALHLPETKGK